MAVDRLVVKQILFIVPSVLSGALFGALFGVISGSFIVSPAAIAEEAMTMIPQQPVEPSLWWKK